MDRAFCRIWLFAITLTAGAFSLISVAGTAKARDSDYAPARLQDTHDKFSRYCIIQLTCPWKPEMLKLIEATLKNERVAQREIGRRLISGDELPIDKDDGRAWQVKAAEQGDALAARYIAAVQRQGEAIEIDEAKEAQALKPQAEAGDIDAIRVLAPMIIGGRGTKQDPAAGLALLKGAAEKGAFEVEKDLFQLYLNGSAGIAVNKPEAMRWLAASARHGNVEAMGNLGFMIVNGAAGEFSLVDGYCWLARAAMLDSEPAQDKLSRMFGLGEKDRRGIVIAPDPIEADFWLRLSARHPTSGSSWLRGRLEPGMTSDQLGVAKRRAEAWTPLVFDAVKGLAIPIPVSLSGTGVPRACPVLA